MYMYKITYMYTLNKDIEIRNNIFHNILVTFYPHYDITTMD